MRNLFWKIAAGVVLAVGPAVAQPINEVVKLLASDGAAGDWFGASVSISGDVAIIGANHDGDLGSQSGSAYIYRRIGSTWVQEAKLLASDGATDDRFGNSVSISGDVAIVGAWGHAAIAFEAGAAYVFRWNGASWVEETKILASDGVSQDQFGHAVAISGDVALVGASSANNIGGVDAGAAYIYRWSGAAWVEEAKLAASDGAPADLFGDSVAIIDGLALVGAYANGDFGYRSGSAYVFRYDGVSAWPEEAKLLPSVGAIEDQFGWSVAVSNDVALVGAREANLAINPGSAYVFRYDGFSAWPEEAKLTASDGAADDNFGLAVAISGDIALVGSLLDDDLGSDSGSAYVFHYANSTWTQQAKLQASDGAADDFFGVSVAIDGEQALISGRNNDDLGSASGSAYVFALPSANPLFTDVANAAGVDVGEVTTSGAWGDYDDDGDLDLFVANYGFGNLLYENDGAGAFADVAPAKGLDDAGRAAGVAWADYDNDGDLDLVVTNGSLGVNKLYRNEGSATFSEVAGTAGILDHTTDQTAVWADYDNDGDLDLYLGLHAGTDRLFRNNGTGSFSNVAGTAMVPVNSANGHGLAWGDYDDDGDLDLFVTNLSPDANVFYQNDGSGNLVEVGSGTNLADTGESYGATWADYDNDGDLDLYMSNGVVGTNRFYRNNGDTTFDNVESIAGVDDMANGKGTAWGDYDGDGDLDLYVANYTDPVNGMAPNNLLYSNNGDGTFVDRALSEGVDDASASYGAAWGDYDGDGDLDLYVLNPAGDANKLFRNNSNGATQWLQIELTGTVSNRSGIGAQIFATAGATTQRRDVSGGSGLHTQDSLPLEFGFGSATVVDQLTVKWPSGIVQTFNNVSTNQVLELSEVSTIEVSIPPLTSPYNQSITVPVQVSETSGTGIVSAEIFIDYDGDLITPISAGLTGALAETGWSIETNIEEGGQIDTYKIAMATDDDVLVGAGTLVNITFQVADVRVPSSSVLQLKHVLFNDGDPGNTTTDGSLTIIGNTGTISSLPATIIPRETITITVVDADADLDGNPGNDQVSVSVENTTTNDIVNLTLAEDGTTAGTFSGTVDTEFGTAAIVDILIQAQAGQSIVATYSDALDAAGNGPTNRTATTTVNGGADGNVAITLVSQPGDPLYIQVSDGDLNTSVSSVQTASVMVENSRTLESFAVVLTEVDADDDVFFGSLPTTSGASTSTDMNTQEDDLVTATYDDVVTLDGNQLDRTDLNNVIYPWGDADDNDVLQAFDAAKILVHVLNGSPIDELASNVDDETITSGINPFDASLILQKRVGLIATFPVQDPTSENHPQGTASPKLMPDQRTLSLVMGEGYLSIHADDRSRLLAGDLTVTGITGRVEMGVELASYLSASRPTDNGVRVVFAGAEATAGPGELFRIYGRAPAAIELTNAVFNNGNITGSASGLTTMTTPTSFALHPNAPNPFNPETTIRFELPQVAEVKLEVFDILGQKVRTLVSGALQAGTHTTVWHGRNDDGIQVGNGVYLYRLQAGEFTQMKRMLLLK